MKSNKFYYLYLLLLLTTWLITIRRFRKLELPLKLFSVQIGLTFFAECLAFFMAVRYHNNMAVYNVFSLLQLILTLLYFNFSIDVFRRKRVGFFLIGISSMIWVLNSYFLQTLHQLNSYFLVYEGLLVVSLALFAFLQMILHEVHDPITRNTYFRINLVLIFFWSITLLSWGIYDYLNKTCPDEVWKFNEALLVVNFITYGGISFSYLKLRIHQPVHGREIPD